MDGMLSQEEINALLGSMNDDSGSTSDASDTAPGSASGGSLSADQCDIIGEISNICMGTAATTLYSLVNQKVTITTPTVTISTWDELVAQYERPSVFINIAYKAGIEGNNVLILCEEDVKVITDLMMGGDGTNLVDELSELHLSAICEAMNQMMGSSATSLSSMLNTMVDISPPSAELVNLAEEVDESKIAIEKGAAFVKVFFKMEIGELVDSSIMQLYPIELAKDLASMFASNQKEEGKKEAEVEKKAETKPDPPQPSMQQTVPDPMQMGQMQSMGIPMMGQGMAYNYAPPPMQQDVQVQPVQFQPFNATFNPITQQENIDLIMDVPLEVTVELGRTSKSIKDILGFAPGTIIELDKIAGEPIDVLVNGKLVAKGEVVVIEESFGIRVTDIIKQ